MTESERVDLAIKKYEQMLLKATEYTGNKEPKKKIFSASMLGNEVLQNYLKFMHGNTDQKKFEANTLGSIYQLGVDVAADKEGSYTNAIRMKEELSNGWIISGETDQFDNEYKVIFDNKVTNPNTIAKTDKEGKWSNYGLQMSVYQWLLYKRDGEVYPVVLPMVNKPFSYYNSKNKYNSLEFIKVDTHSIEDTEALLLEATNKLQEYIDYDAIPPKCDPWMYKGKGMKYAQPMRCIHYCDFKKNCKYYSEVSPMAKREALLYG